MKFINTNLLTNNRKTILRLCHKIAPMSNEKEDPKLAADVMNYLDSQPEYRGIRNKLPKTLFRKYKTPESMYLINEKTADIIVKTVEKYIEPKHPVVEVNPGICVLSKKILRALKNDLYMYENVNHFSPYLSDLKSEYPDRITYQIADFFGMWKLAFKDRIDNGQRLKELLGDLSTNDNNRSVKIIGSMPGFSFIKHLLNNIIFHNTTNQLGHPDLFITMPILNYEFLTDKQIQSGKHKSVPALFQLFFDYKILTTVPKAHFLPWTFPHNVKKASVIHESSLYLVNITQKEKLPCPPEYLPLLWYFFKPHMFFKSTRVIPMLEQWIPGCGVWLISGQDPPDSNKSIAPGEDDAQLPHMTIFTEFGDLSLAQKVTVFKRFVSWPEFEQCPFKVTMESNLPKFVLNLEDNDKESSGAHMDDIESSDTEIET